MSRIFAPIIYEKLAADGATFEIISGALYIKSLSFDVLPAGTTAGDVMTWNGTTWESAAPSGGGGGLTFDQAAAMAAFIGDFA